MWVNPATLSADKTCVTLPTGKSATPGGAERMPLPNEWTLLLQCTTHVTLPWVFAFA